MSLFDEKTKVRRLTIWLLACATVSFAVALKVHGCGWGYYTDHTVRFNLYRQASEYARLPQLPNSSRMNQNKLFSWDEDAGLYNEDYEDDERREKEINALWWAAADAELKGDHVKELKTLREYLESTQGLRKAGWISPDLQPRRNSAFDKLDALTALEQGSPPGVVSSYLFARTAYDASRPAEGIKETLAPCRGDRNLQDNAAYLEAAVFHRDGKSIGVDSFAEVARRYPKSEKREAALFMSAIDSMKASKSSNESGLEPDASLRDEEWESAQRRFQQVMREYPRGRYYIDARGWLAHLWVRAGERARALADYYRMLASDNEFARAEAVVSIGLVRRRTDESEMEKLEGLIENEPRTAMAYAYHEIYNYAVRHRCSPKGYDYAGNENCKKRRTANELQRIAGFATRMMARYPGTQTGGGFVLRVAEAQLELENNADAARLARRALTLGVVGDQRAEALWVAGAAEYRLKRYDTARSALETLVTENPDNRYSEGGRRMLAMLLEDSGDLEGALDVYLALDYRFDVAYYIDVLMTPIQLAAFIQKRPSLRHRDEMLYALGIRYLRERNWRDARDVFLRIRTVGRDADDAHTDKFYEYEEARDIKRESPKGLGFDGTIRGVRPQWIDQDLRTANDLETLERQVELAEGDEARAEALYQVASYQFERSLLFYNPIAWKGIRHYLLDDLDQSGSFRQPGESQLLFDHMQKHDMAANSLPIFLEVARRFPNTRAARDALFTAAVCHERLHEYNNYWREIYSNGGYAGTRLVTYRDVRAAYPSYRLPRGTLGWEPATRTVNGGPGWDKPPKPAPRPSRWVRAAYIANFWMSEFFKFLNRVLSDLEYLLKQGWGAIVAVIRWVAHWLWILAMVGWLWFVWRRAGESRTLMKEALAQCKARPIEERGNSHLAVSNNVVSATLDKYLGHDLRDQWLEAGRDLTYKLSQLGSHRRGKAIIAFYAAAHGLLVCLLLRLVLRW